MNRAALVFTGLAIAQRSSSLVLLPFVTRAMSTEEYGAVSVLTAINLLVIALLGAPLEPAVFRTVARAESEGTLVAARRVTLYFVPLAAAILALFPLLWGGELLGVQSYLLSLEMVASGLSVYALSFALPALRAEMRLGRYVAVASTSLFALLVSKILLVVVLEMGPLGWVFSDILGAVITISVAVVLSRPIGACAAKPRYRDLSRFSLPLMPHSALNWLIINGTRPLLALFLPLADVALYAAASAAAGVGLMLVTEYNRAASLEYARAKIPVPSSSALASVIRNQRVLGYIATVAICVGSPIYTQWILPPEYAAVTPVLAVLSIGPILLSTYGIAMNVLIQTGGQTRWAWVTSTVGAATTVLGIVAFGPTLAAVGAAIANVTCYAAMLVGAAIVLRRLRIDVQWRRAGFTLKRLALPATAASVAVSVSIAAPLSPLFYVSLALAAMLAALGVWFDKSTPMTDPREERPS